MSRPFRTADATGPLTAEDVLFAANFLALVLSAELDCGVQRGGTRAKPRWGAPLVEERMVAAAEEESTAPVTPSDRS
jgi:hypothetical protein